MEPQRFIRHISSLQSLLSVFVITSDVAGAEVTRSHLPRGLHSALRLEHATQQVRKILRKNMRVKK